MKKNDNVEETAYAPSLFDLTQSRRRAELELAAAHMESGLDHNEFVDLIDALGSAVRLEHDAVRESRIPPAGGTKKAQWMKPEHAQKIQRDAQAYRLEHGRSKLPPGYAQAIADEFGYTLGQVQTAIYGKGK